MVTLCVLWTLVGTARPGCMYRDLGNAISRVAKAAGFSVVTTYCGHGVHRLFLCAPSIPHYAKNKAVGVMKVGHVFTIEPMINAGMCRRVVELLSGGGGGGKAKATLSDRGGELD